MVTAGWRVQFAQLAGGPTDPQGWKNEMFIEFCDITNELALCQAKIAECMYANIHSDMHKFEVPPTDRAPIDRN